MGIGIAFDGPLTAVDYIIVGAVVAVVAVGIFLIYRNIKKKNISKKTTI